MLWSERYEVKGEIKGSYSEAKGKSGRQFCYQNPRFGIWQLLSSGPEISLSARTSACVYCHPGKLLLDGLRVVEWEQPRELLRRFPWRRRLTLLHTCGVQCSARTISLQPPDKATEWALFLFPFHSGETTAQRVKWFTIEKKQSHYLLTQHYLHTYSTSPLCARPQSQPSNPAGLTRSPGG